MFIGDSLTVGHFETTLQAMAHGRPDWDGSSNDGTNENPVISIRYDFCASEAELGDGASAIPFNLSLTINRRLQGYYPQSDFPKNYAGDEWSEHRRLLKREHDTRGLVLIVNRGAWWAEDIDAETYIANFLAMVHEDLPNATVIFRATSMPHVNCMQYSVPPPNAPPFEPSQYEFIEGEKDMLDEDAGVYYVYWRNVTVQTRRVVRPLVEAARDPAAIYLDIAPSSNARPDQHRHRRHGDCLHFCIPGPVDVWVHLVLGVLNLIDKAL